MIFKLSYLDSTLKSPVKIQIYTESSKEKLHTFYRLRQLILSQEGKSSKSGGL